MSCIGIISKPATDEYRDGYDRVFGGKRDDTDNLSGSSDGSRSPLSRDGADSIGLPAPNDTDGNM